MIPQRKDDDDDDDDELDSAQGTTNREALATSTVNPLAGYSVSIATSTVTGVPSKTWHNYPPPFTMRPGSSWPQGDYNSRSLGASPSTLTWTTKTTSSLLWDSQIGPQTTSSPTFVSDDGSLPPTTSNGYENGRPGWHGAKGNINNGGMYAAAAITPVVVLALVGGIVFFCLRRRKRQRANIAATQSKVREMKTHPRPQSIIHAYMAPPPTISPQYAAQGNHLLSSSHSSAPHPIILGPIPSGANGAYFTGIDTSDVVSMTSASNLRSGPPNPFADNDSLAEPPPPYRPRSAAPPSLTNSSRHSSLRSSTVPPATSRTRLIDRSPFDDPIDDDAISELSGPTEGRNEDSMSAVSDLSYQQDPVVHRSPL